MTWQIPVCSYLLLHSPLDVHWWLFMIFSSCYHYTTKSLPQENSLGYTFNSLVATKIAAAAISKFRAVLAIFCLFGSFILMTIFLFTPFPSLVTAALWVSCLVSPNVRFAGPTSQFSVEMAELNIGHVYLSKPEVESKLGQTEEFWDSIWGLSDTSWNTRFFNFLVLVFS